MLQDLYFGLFCWVKGSRNTHRLHRDEVYGAQVHIWMAWDGWAKQDTDYGRLETVMHKEG